MAMLTIEDLQVYYGMINAIKGVSFTVDAGEIIALIGANGAGKTTILHTITGLVAPRSGHIEFEGHDLIKTPAHKIPALGMAHVPEGRHVFPEMTVEENLQMGAFISKNKEETAAAMQDVYEKFPRLRERRRQLAGTLSGGEQQMVAVGRALMGKPSIILMDEPFVGLDPKASHILKGMMREVCDAGGAIFFSTHVLEVAEKLCDKVAIIKGGKLIRSGTMEEVKGDDSLEEVFLELEGESC